MRLLLIASLMMAGCGTAQLGGKSDKDKDNDDSSSDSDDPHSRYVLTTSDLPKCNSDVEGWLIYVKSDKTLKACLSSSWETVTTGEDEDNKLVEEIYGCEKSIDLDPDARYLTKGMTSMVTMFASGEVMISCMDQMADASILYADASSGMVMYPAVSGGATGPLTCVGAYAFITFDPAAPNVATWSRNAENDKALVACKKLFPES